MEFYLLLLMAAQERPIQSLTSLMRPIHFLALAQQGPPMTTKRNCYFLRQRCSRDQESVLRGGDNQERILRFQQYTISMRIRTAILRPWPLATHRKCKLWRSWNLSGRRSAK